MATIRVTNLREFTRKCDEADAAVATFFRDGLLAIAEDVAKDIRPRYAAKSAKGAGGVKAKVTRPGNAIVAQTLRKSRGKRQRKNFGPLEMRESFLPGLDAGEPRAQAALITLFNEVNDRWE